MGVGNSRPENERLIRFFLYRKGMVDDLGRVTPAGRQAIRDKLAVPHGREDWMPCVVWNANFCTFFLPDGTMFDSTSPPHGEPALGEQNTDVDAVVFDYHTFELPKKRKSRIYASDEPAIGMSKSYLPGRWFLPTLAD